MSDLVSRIESRIGQIENLLGVNEVPKGISKKSAVRTAFARELIGSIDKLGLGLLPALDGFNLTGEKGWDHSVGPYKPNALRRLTAESLTKSDPKLDALSAVLEAEAEQDSKRTNDIRALLPIAPVKGRSPAVSNALHLRASRAQVPGIQSPDLTNILERALEAYRAGPGSAKPKTEDPAHR